MSTTRRFGWEREGVALTVTVELYEDPHYGPSYEVRDVVEDETGRTRPELFDEAERDCYLRERCCDELAEYRIAMMEGQP